MKNMIKNIRFKCLKVFLIVIAFLCSGCTKKDLSGNWKSVQVLESQLANPEQKDKSVIKMKVLQTVEYYFSDGEFKKQIVQSLDSFEILDENYSSVTKENLDENINKNFCVYGKYALLGNEIYFNCEKISDSGGNYFPYEDFASPEMPQEYSESISFNEETIFIGGTEYFRGDCIKTNVILN